MEEAVRQRASGVVDEGLQMAHDIFKRLLSID